MQESKQKITKLVALVKTAKYIYIVFKSMMELVANFLPMVCQYEIVVFPGHLLFHFSRNTSFSTSPHVRPASV